MIPMILFALIAALGFFHVISSEVTACGFLAWFFVMVVRSVVLRAIDESKEEPECIPPVGLGGCLAPPQGGDATIPTRRLVPSGLGSDAPILPMRIKSRYGHSFEVNVPTYVYGYTAKEVADGLALMASAGKITVGSEEAEQLPAYDEPKACYPMEMRIHD
jgi:hypothetical protein